MTAVQRNHVKVIGRGDKTLMFAHGYGCDQSMWRAVTPAFEDKYKIVLFDYVGAGLSDCGRVSTVPATARCEDTPRMSWR